MPFNRVCLRHLTFFLLFGFLSAQADDATDTKPLHFRLGTQAIGGRYHFSKEAPLLESARLIAELGSDIMKFSISSKAAFGKTQANVITDPKGLKTLTEIARIQRIEPS